MEPGDAGAELARAVALRARLAQSLRLPSWFHESIGAAIAVQVGATAYTLVQPSASVGSVAVLVAGLLVFGVVAAVQLQRFRRLNGVWLGGLASRSVLGTSTPSSLVYAASLASACWAASSGSGWLAAIAAVAGGIGYAVVGRLWWAAYHREPAKNARGEPAVFAAGVFLLALFAFVVVAVGRW
jgi:hypothetical protein